MRVRLRLFKSKTRNYFRVEVYSQRRPELKAVNEVPRSAKEKKLVPLAAAACTEYLNATYREDMNPDAAAVEMESLLSKLLANPEGTVIQDDGPLGEE